MIVKDNGGGDFEQPEAGTYASVCYRLIDLGTQTSEYEGKKTTRRQVMLSWELDELMSDGRPYAVSKFYTASLGEKATLRHDLESWRGRAFNQDELNGFHLEDVLGKACMVNLVKTDKGKTKVSSVSKLPKQISAPARKNEVVYFSLDEYNQHVFDSLSEGIKKIIMQSPEFAAAISRKQRNADGLPAGSEDLEDAAF